MSAAVSPNAARIAPPAAAARTAAAFSSPDCVGAASFPVAMPLATSNGVPSAMVAPSFFANAAAIG